MPTPSTAHPGTFAAATAAALPTSGDSPVPSAPSAGSAGSADPKELRDPMKAMHLVAAGALIAGPVLWSLGMLTSPPSDSMADADYIESLVRDTTMTQISALLLHYGNLVIALGVLAAPSLVRGRRGAWAAVVGAILTAIGFANVSGQVFSD